MIDSQLNLKQALAVCHYVGFRNRSSSARLVIAVAVMGAESGRQYLAEGVNPDGSRDRGLFQINDRAHPDFPDVDAFLPIPNARYAYKLSGGGRIWGPWAAFTSGRYEVNMPKVQAELDDEKAGKWETSIAEREAVFKRVGDGWEPK